ncbi:hypothetical protein M3O96_20835 [Aquiflexum sp. TKW24L]|uniref:hypothetical protein n=1 Tax=Aquiflexum sp. TKW24L TaxID=2942212 RepID=UPI0020BEDA4E|nr:hypothetical protein [Aquiflexum sp. TKW24L]MCL6261559.1 hypothetical protein [Aquiflexum sp. TKW24L]
MEIFNESQTRWDERSDGSKVLSGMFRDRECTDRAYNSLVDKGYGNNEINVVMTAETREKYYGDLSKDSEFGAEHTFNSSFGSRIGSTAGVIAGAQAAIEDSVVIHGLGVLIAGPLVSDLTGAVSGGMISVLKDSGIPEPRAKLYDSGIKEGNVVIYVSPKDDADAIHLYENWKNLHAEAIHY